MPENQRLHLNISGMTCANCEKRIDRALSKLSGVVGVSVSYSAGTADVEYCPDVVSVQEIRQTIENLHYTVLPDKGSSNLARSAGFIAIILALFWFLDHFGILNLLVPGQLANSKAGYGMLFVIGLLTSVHCVAMCGGINLSQCLPGGNVSGGKGAAFRPARLAQSALLYNLGRVISYTAVGLILGAVGWLIDGGDSLGISLVLQGVLKLLAGAVMVVMGINLLGIFPALRRFTLRLPKLNLGSKSPLVVGMLNGLMPCGPLQAMQIVALASGNPLTGALSMLLFSLGTVPLMLGLGSLVAALGKKFTRTVMTVGAVLVVVLGLAMFSQGWSLSGIQMSGFGASSQSSGVTMLDGVQVVNSTLQSGSYPNITVGVGTPVKWIINAPEGSINGCNGRMLIREYGIEYSFVPGENVIEFTPMSAGRFQYTCWMGMIRGTITVTEGDS
jgi:sulfite exporter TauE/SafE/copper chaperone CopZ